MISNYIGNIMNYIDRVQRLATAKAVCFLTDTRRTQGASRPSRDTDTDSVPDRSVPNT